MQYKSLHGEINVYSIIVHVGLPIFIRQKKEPRSWSFQEQLFRSGPCLLCIALFFILIALIAIAVLSSPYSYGSIGFNDDSVIVYNGTEFWPTKWLAFTQMDPFDTPHLVDIYSVPPSGLKIYQQLETYSSKKLYASSTRSAGKVGGVYLRPGTTFYYNITASSGNRTTTDGLLIVFTSNTDYHDYTSGEAYFHTGTAYNFSIGANNRPLNRNFSVTVNTTSYYYFACTLPSNTQFFFNSSFDVSHYNYSNSGKRLITLDHNADKYFYLPGMTEPTILLAHIQPNGTDKHSSINVEVQYSRILPSFSLFLLIGMTLLVVAFVIMLNIVM